MTEYLQHGGEWIDGRLVTPDQERRLSEGTPPAPTLTTVRLQKVEAGHYRTPDGQFDIRNTYDPSGPPWVRYAGQEWLLTDTTTGRLIRFETLADARWHIGHNRECQARKGAAR